MTKEIIKAFNIEAALIESGMAKENAAKLLKDYGAPFTEAGKLLDEHKNIVVTDENDIEGMKKAYDTRRKLQKIRIDIEKRHDFLKADSLAIGRAIDLVQRVAVEQIKPAEAYLKLQENYAEVQRELRREQLTAARKVELEKYCEDTTIYNFGDMGDEAFAMLLAQVKDMHEAKLRIEAKAAADKLAAEAKAKAEQEAKEKEMAEARVKAEAEAEVLRKANEELEIEAAKQAEIKKQLEITHQIELAKQAEEQAKIDAAAKIEREKLEAEAAKEKAAADAMRQAEAYRKAKAEQEAKEKAEAEAKALNAPDKEKLLAWLAELCKTTEIISVKTAPATELTSKILNHLNKTINMYVEMVEKEL